MRKTIFISDLHLEEKREDITALFLNLLSGFDASIDALYILGDFFELWIGDDDSTPFHREIIHTLRQAVNKGLPIYLMHGNRDFLIGKTFLKQTGCQFLAEQEKVNMYGTPVLLMHGDTLCTDDIVYLKARKKMRHPFFQKLFLLLPLRVRQKIAAHLRQKSNAHTKSTSMNKMDTVQSEVESIMKIHTVDHLIHGHTHKPHVHHFFLNNVSAARIVLGAWHDHAEILVWDETGKKELVKLR